MTHKASFDFSFSFTGLIWQTVIDPGQAIMILEIREPENHELTYRMLDLRSCMIEEFMIEEADWWTTVHRLQYPLLILEKYGDPQDPSKKGVILYDVSEHKVIQVIDQFQLVSIEQDKLVGHEPANQSQPKSVKISKRNLVQQPKSGVTVKYPVYYAPATESYQTVFDFLDKEPPGIGCEYFQWKNYIIISYYERLGTKFDRKLLVVRGDHEICHELQDEGLSGFASGAFFLLNDLLVFIKNGNQINGIEL